MIARLLPLLLLVGCDPDPGDAGTDPTDPPATEDLCADAPLTTYDNFGAGFLVEACQVCHSADTVDRQGAPEDVVFDTEEDVWAWSDRILVRAAAEEPTMPPQGGIQEDDRYLLEVWLSCGG